LGVGLTTPHHKITAVTEPQERRPRPDMGCRAIGWMDAINIRIMFQEVKTFLQTYVSEI
jgi:hypothetical protein